MTRLTGSCAPAIIGASPHESPLQLYARLKTGADPHAAIKAVRRQVERLLLEMLCEERGLYRNATADEVAKAENAPDWLTSNPDGWAGDTLLVVKSCLWMPAADLDGSPHLEAIVQHELAATGAQHAAVGVEVAGGWFKTGWAGADVGAQARLLEAEAAFVARLEAGVPPAPETAGDVDAVKLLYPEDTAGEIMLSAEAAGWWREVRRLRAAAREAHEKAARLEARLRAAIGAHGAARLPGGRRLRLRFAGSGRRLVEVH